MVPNGLACDAVRSGQDKVRRDHDARAVALIAIGVGDADHHDRGIRRAALRRRRPRLTRAERERVMRRRVRTAQGRYSSRSSVCGGVIGRPLSVSTFQPPYPPPVKSTVRLGGPCQNRSKWHLVLMDETGRRRIVLPRSRAPSTSSSVAECLSKSFRWGWKILSISRLENPSTRIEADQIDRTHAALTQPCSALQRGTMSAGVFLPPATAGG